MGFIIKYITILLIKITPKLNYCLLKGVPTYEDSLVSVYQQIPLDKVKKIIWSCYDLDLPFPSDDRGKTIYIKKGSFEEFFYGVFSKYIFTTHGHFVPIIPKNQICVNIWHGMPLKAIGRLNGQASRSDTYLCSTSELFQDLMARAFDMPIEKTKITGIPRNDLLISSSPDEIWAKAGIDRKKYKKVFFWLPTYRKCAIGDHFEDGVEVDNIFNMADFSTSEFQEFLAANNCLCIIKPHPMAPVKDTLSYDNILVIDEHWLWAKKLTLYSLVGQSDFLVSDISSVIIDYMLLDKPIIICFEDAKEYKASRNVTFEPISDWLPCTMTKNITELKLEILNCCENQDLYKDKRERLKSEFHTYFDFSSTQRVLNLLWNGTNVK